MKKKCHIYQQVYIPASDNTVIMIIPLYYAIGAQDLIGQLLQPDSSRRVMLDEVMHHLWVTKDNTQPLKPYEHPTHDPLLQVMVNP